MESYCSDLRIPSYAARFDYPADPRMRQIEWNTPDVKWLAELWSSANDAGQCLFRSSVIRRVERCEEKQPDPNPEVEQGIDLSFSLLQPDLCCASKPLPNLDSQAILSLNEAVTGAHCSFCPAFVLYGLQEYIWKVPFIRWSSGRGGGRH